ncbi:hypothetical protein IFM89_009180 [Coptis chinensis]|uniref:Uncharacterized protein n=1 Tax=Coptis chinensis TaxID=261450 RepID=A0A835IXZ1_9MAGN|nr:hypothetical protein IFM89_009180 [Coptis chinensis]
MAAKSGEITENKKPHLHFKNASLNSEIITGSACSLSLPSDLSEAPDIKNWFSSYVYESPALGTEDDMVLGNSESGKMGFDSEELHQLEMKIPGSSCSASLLSEPPDIRNWFSSYVYESPALDTEDELKCFISKKSELEKVGFDTEEHNEFGTKGICLGKRQSTPKVCDEETVGGKHKEENSSGRLKQSVISCSSKCDSIQKPETSFTMHDGSPEKTFYKEDVSERQRWTRGADCTSKADSETNKPPSKMSISCSNNKEKGVNESAANGFISTKKNKSTHKNDMNCSNNSQDNNVQYVKKMKLKSPLNEGQGGLGRKPLYEKTNLHYEVAMPETSGKWQCPQKSKPDLGPPMKQLGLERWVHRVLQ